ncbi:MAG TPA: YceI family protein [Candidatus Sulfotelmatobacter sp.]|nr:YceI family protein [Candidatus Sulfotelmatobacter sp.]
MRIAVAWLLLLLLLPCVARAQAPVVALVPQESWIHFNVKASTTISGKFDRWDGKLIFTSPDETTGILQVQIQADSVDTGSGMKNGKLKGKDFFDVQENPEITFVSKKIAKTAANTYEVDGDFTIRGVSNPEKLTLTVSNKGGGSGEIRGTMVFNRKDYGMNKGIPFIRIADHVDVTFHFRVQHVGGPPLAITH